MRKTMQRIGLAGWLFAAVSLLAGDESTKTNLPATITITVSTNVVSGDNSSGCYKCSHGPKFTLELVYPPGSHFNCEPFKAATERWTITNVIRSVRLTTQWNGKDLTYSEETVLSSTTNRMRLHTEWKQD